jgi:protein SCO1/2
MPDISRRKFLSYTAAAPLTAAVLSQSAAAAGAGSTAPAQKVWPTVTQESARKRIQELHLPNVPLISHEGKRYLFYDDLVKDKAVSLNFFFANCDEICPLVTANLAKVQKLLGKEVGSGIQMYSFTLKPEEDTVDVIREYRKKYGAGPGWTFFTADPKDMEKLRAAIGFTYPDPVIDKDTTQHIGNIRFGNEPLMYWSACPGMAHAKWVAETLEYVMHPNDDLGPAVAGAKR